MIKSSEIKAAAESKITTYKSLFSKLEGRSDEVIDKHAQTLHDKAFSHIDCRTCANCCKTAGPLLLQEDIDRLAGHLKINSGDFIQSYLLMDEDGDFVFKGKPCPFLQTDDLCSIYEIRPNACREYPHTNRKQFKEIDEIHIANAAICPAVQEVLDAMVDLEAAGKLAD